VRARIAATFALSASIALIVTGCGFITPQATTDDYTPSDGTAATIGSLKVLNALIISADGENGNLVAGFANQGTERITVSLQWEGGDGTEDRTVTVGAGEFKNIGTDEVFELEGIDAELGSLFPVFVQHGDETGKQMLVPVLDNSLEEYQDLLP
jgi:hypothetical protein